MQAGTLYVVATPIGNLGDITLRALEVLGSVSVIACEDTRRTRVLLDRHGITGRLIAFHKFNESRASVDLVGRLAAGESVALVSDGGTPAVSDPGYRLVRDALDAGVNIVPIPGPSAFVAAVSASGLPSEWITFRGFLPHRAGERRRLIESFREEPATQVFYESPHRIAASLEDLAAILGPRQAAVAREITKRFETWYRGSLQDVAREAAQGTVKGEYCIVIEGAPTRRERGRQARARAAGRAAEGSGGPPRARGGRVEADREGVEPRADAGPGAGGAGARGRESEGEARTGPRTLDGQAGARGESRASAAQLRRCYQRALASGADRREALKRAALECGFSRREAYILLRVD